MLLISVLSGWLGVIALRSYAGKFRHIVMGIVLAILMTISLVVDMLILATHHSTPQEIILLVFQIIINSSFAVSISMYISQYIRENRESLKTGNA